MPGIDAYILIGGRSSRLGADKAFVDLDGSTLLQRSIDAIRTGIEPTRLTAVAGNAEQFAIQAIIADLRFIFDLHENRGPLGGLHAALADATTSWIFLLACDYPFVSADLITLLSEQVSDEYGCVVPEQSDGRLQPLCGFYNVRMAKPVVQETLDLPRVPPPMHEIVAQLNPRIVRFQEYEHLAGADQSFANINTVQELEAARQIARKLSPRK